MLDPDDLAYLERIRQVSKATKLDDKVFTNWTGEPTKSLYYDLLVTLLTDAGLRLLISGRLVRRSSCAKLTSRPQAPGTLRRL